MAISIEQRGRIRIVAINRPEARNAVDPVTARELFDAFLAADVDPGTDVAILTGTGSAFCAGFDLKAAAGGGGADWIRSCDIPDDWADPDADPIPGPMGPSRLMLATPVIAAVEGHAVAGGMELAAWADVRIAASDAVFGVYCRRWGVPLIDGGTVRLPRICGQGRANDLILTGRPVAADEALAMGLANRVVEPGGALAAAVAYVDDLLRFPQACMCADLVSARLSPQDMAMALRREWQSCAVLEEAILGAARFAGGKGRGGDFTSI